MVQHHGSRAASHGSAPFRHLAGTVLLVDDDRDLLEGLGRGLRHSDYRVLLADGGAAALEVMAHEPVDVIVSDLEMPAMGGIELLDRARECCPGCVRIVLTGHATAQSAIDAINQDEVFRYLTKPVSRDTLSAALHMAFQKLEAERALEAAAERAQPPRPVRAWCEPVLSEEEREAIRHATRPASCVDAEPVEREGRAATPGAASGRLILPARWS
jgi:DNA-binding NtrC family response regulator